MSTVSVMPRVEGLTDKRYLGRLCPKKHEYLDTGKSLRIKGSSSCVECERVRGLDREWCNYKAQQDWRDRNPEKVRAYSSVRKNTRYYQEYYKKQALVMSAEDKVKIWLKSVATRAKDRGLEYDLTVEWVVKNLPESCPVLGIPLIFGIGQGVKASPNSPSIDRFDNSKGYTQDNCRIISRRANVLKSDANSAEMEKVLAYMKKIGT